MLQMMFQMIVFMLMQKMFLSACAALIIIQENWCYSIAYFVPAE